MISPALLGTIASGNVSRTLLWLRAEETLGATVPIDSSRFARVPYNTQGTTNATQTKCGSSVFGANTGYRIDYTEAELPIFEDQPFLIQHHWYNTGTGATERTFFSRMINQFTPYGWRLRSSAGTGWIFTAWDSGGTVRHYKEWTVSTSTGLWRHVALEWTGTELNAYLDGTLLTPAASTGTPQLITPPSADFKIGWDRTSNIAQNSGYIDDFVIERGPTDVVVACR